MKPRLILEREVLKGTLQEPELLTVHLWSSIEAGAFTHPAYRATATQLLIRREKVCA